MESIKKLYKIGFGPSSSHTMGPAIAANIFKNKNKNATSFKVELYGSLALTGKGHLTDYILKNELGDNTKIYFNYEQSYNYHPNAMKFFAYENENAIDEWLVFSVGGGEIKELNEPRNTIDKKVYPHTNFEDVLKYINERNITLVEYIYKFDDELKGYLEEVYQIMEHSIQTGLEKNDVLPGRLKLTRKAKSFYQKYLKDERLLSLIYAYSLSVSEQNASGDKIVTAPTCGSSGVVPGVLFAMKDFENIEKSKIINAMAISGLVGNFVKTNASISGAEVGCQGEIGVACSMASAAVCYLLGGSDKQIEYAAEMGLEHNLGMTCDPVDGMVQIPCIERNAVAAISAYNIANYVIMTDGNHYISFDNVVDVMKETGLDLHTKYKETSIGGLAKINNRKEK